MKTFLLSLLAIVVCFTGCICLQYKNALNVETATELTESLAIITTKAEVGVVKGKRPSKYRPKLIEWSETKKKGTSFPIGDGYQLALSHATMVRNSMIVRTMWGPMKISRKVKNHKFYIGDREIKLIGRVGDLSLFKKSWNNKPFKLGNDPIVGTYAVVLGDSLLNGNNTKTGIVSMLDTGRYAKMGNDMENSFLHTVPTNPGDSGSPMLATNKRGEYEVIGIVNATIPRAQGYNFAIKVSHIKKVVKDLMRGE